ncbi:MAG: response regulator [Bacteroidaceae bacterium]|nr:response regulator [Bacteroidaceae bacterium]
MKRLLTFLSVTVISFLTVSAHYIQQVQIGTDKGLSCNAVKSFTKDSYGRLWVGTINGADLISNGTITQYQYFTVGGNNIVTGDVASIGCSRRAIIATNNHIIDFDPDNDSTRIVSYNGRNLRTEYIVMSGDTAYFYNLPLCAVIRYDMNTYSTEIIAQFPTERQFHFSKILKVSNDTNQLLLAEEDRGFYSLNLTTGNLTHMDMLGEDIISRAVFIDSNDILWVAYRNKGITGYYVKSGFDKIAHFDTSNSEIPSDNINCMDEMPDGNLLLCTENEGVCVLNRKSGKIEQEPFGVISPLHVLCSMVDDKENQILLGTLHRGIITLKRSFFHSVINTSIEDEIETANIPISAYQDNEGSIWFGTGGFGLSIYDEKTEKQSGISSTKGMRISGICRFDDDNLLLTDRSRGLFLFNRKRGTVTPATFLSDAGINLSSSRLTNLKITSTPDGDIMLFNCNGRHFIYRHKIGELREIMLQMNGEENKGLVDDIMMRPSHATVICNGCIYEVDYRTLLARLIFQNQNEDESAISHVVEDSRGIIWACSPDELINYDPRSNKINRIMDNHENGVFLSMAIDRLDHLWITTDKAMMIMYDTNEKEFKEPYTYYGRDCGTRVNFLPNFSLVSEKGYVYFPHTSGLMVIDPEDVNIRYNSNPYPIALTKIVLDGTIYEAAANGKKSKTLDIPNNYSLLDVHVAVNQFDPTREVPLKYTLLKKGRPYPVTEKITGNTELSIPKSSHGLYTLTVSQRTIQGWSEPEEILSYKVARPFIMTVPAYLLIIAIIVSISVTISKVGISLKQIDMDRAMNAQENKHKDEKISLLSNMAHELRTPLSIIYNPVKDMLEENSVRGADHERLQRIFNQVQKMTDMVNLILDKGTSDITKSDIVIEQVNLNEWLGKIIDDFKIDIFAKGLKTQFIPMPGLGKVDMDVKMVETAVTNIMTNAIKYSDTGTITVSTGHDKGRIWIKFHDEGRGFTCKPEELFKRYYRENETVPGYGLGLSHANDLINLLDGTIKAEKNNGPGSTFTIEIPDDLAERYHSAQAQPQMPVMAEQPDFGSIEEPAQTEEVNFDTKSMTLLIVDDQDDILQFIKDEYSPLFKTIYTAHDGKEALDLIRQRMPNVVVSDIMMPRMNGFELCKTIKTDLELSSIPVILLTSRSDPKNQDMGYKMGADSFLPKPFDSKLLYKIIRSQLKNRFEIKRQYATSFFTAISEDQTFSAADEQFVLKLNRFIRENLSNTMLGVDMIVDHMNVSRTTLFNKMNNLVGASTNKYIRRIRIDVAKEMLSKTNKSVGTIAEETGFSESQYFSTVFKQETGMTPSQFKDSLRKI